MQPESAAYPADAAEAPPDAFRPAAIPAPFGGGGKATAAGNGGGKSVSFVFLLFFMEFLANSSQYPACIPSADVRDGCGSGKIPDRTFPESNAPDVGDAAGPGAQKCARRARFGVKSGAAL